MIYGIHAQSLIQAFESWAPKYLAYEKDKIGLLIGTLNKRVKKVMVTLDVLENVVDEAIEQEVDLIIAHHPVIFKPLAQVLNDSGQGKIVSKCIKNDIAVYVAHTNLDIADGGVNDLLAEAMALQSVDILVPTYTEKLFKLAVYVPEAYVDQVQKALGDSGAGYIGNYSHCSFQSNGIGAFQPEVGSQPFIGDQHRLEKVSEVKVETIVPERLIKRATSLMIKSHPYEEVAYDVYPLNNKGKTYGLGRVGRLPKPMTLASFAHFVKEVYGVEGLRMVGDPNSIVNKVAVIGGDGNSYLSQASFKGADVLVTGDIYYHTAHDAMLMGLNLIDPGHHIESVMKQAVAEYLKKVIKENKHDTEVIVSKENTNPFQFI